ncbi:MFS transporter [Bacillus haynesii]|uniref:MFS transporter n=2 Tax=Bacillus haynesii TaxID=1925021 RepID=UPI0022821F76|nr:MFS transporter [Bacillus haynesii]MCY9372981.1 MFS transporter [Bacillus haynesii]MEC0719876.1 MFS transporter [Bacillus haynesii]MEC0763428.1 MFS transporter [Bacillus haynesii]MEC0784325.1 MFS transporter [Bacillus haynesii]
MKGNILRFPFYYGWAIVLISALAVFFSGPGQTYSNSIFIDEYIQHFGWSRSEVSGIYSAATLCAGILMMFVGRFVDKLGQRKMMVVVGLVLGAACFFNSFAVNIWMVAAGFFLIRLFGQGSMTLLPNTLVPQWFIKKRGRAMSFMAVGSFASAALFPVLNAWMIEKWNWQFTWQVWGFLLVFFFVPLAFFCVRNQPEDIGLLPDGEKGDGEANQNISIRPSQPISEVDWTLKEATKTASFWYVLICVGIPALVNTGITFHLLSILGENNLSSQVAATVLSLMAIIGFPITMVSGFILEKIKSNLLLAFIFMMEMILLLLLLMTKSIETAILFGVVWGMASGLERITLNIIWPNYFGRRHIGSINGVAMAVMVAGSAFGPLPLGMGYDMFQSYTQVLLLMLILPGAGFICALLAKKPVKQKSLSTKS